MKTLLLVFSLHLTAGPSFAAAITLAFEPAANNPRLVLGPVSEPGALFVLGAPDLPSLLATPTLLLLTNTPLTNQISLAAPTGGGFSNQGFFRAALWPGQAPALVDIPAGTFLMGAPPAEAEHFAWEDPQTWVTITRSFKMGQFELTQAQYQAATGNNPSYFSGTSNCPVEQVSWSDATNYCALLTTSQRLAGCLPPTWAYRLPTEAEWEYACRAGTTTAFAYGAALRSGMANFDGREEYDAAVGTEFNPDGVVNDHTGVVGTHAANAWGLFDMHGNVWEWCLDWFGDQLPGGSVTDPQGADSGLYRILRGGCWYDDGSICRSACRGYGDPGYIGGDTGFRVVLAPAGP